MFIQLICSTRVSQILFFSAGDFRLAALPQMSEPKTVALPVLTSPHLMHSVF